MGDTHEWKAHSLGSQMLYWEQSIVTGCRKLERQQDGSESTDGI